MLSAVSLLLFSNSAGLTVDNLKAGEIFRYPVISVRGTCGTDSISLGLAKNQSISVKAVGGRYIGLIELKPGANTIYAKSGGNVVTTKVFYQPMKTPYKVHAVWYVSSDEGNDYPYAKPGAKQQLNEKFDTMLKTMQTFTAEAMDAAGYGKKTFALDTDKDGKVIVTIVKSTKTGAQLRAEDGGKTWGDGYGQIKKLFDENTQKYASLIAFSRWDTATQKAQGAFALGGGALAMMYGGTVSLYPNSIAEVQSAFADTEFIDPAKTYDDSAFRRTRWANVSTAYGAFLHELGHTFGLPHCADPFGIMSRGFDRFNRRFMLTEPPVYGQEKGAEFKPDQIARWDKFHAARLNWSPWFQPDGKNGGEFERRNPPKITIDGDKVTIESVRGIRTAGAELDDKYPSFKEYKDKAPLVVTFSLDELRKEIKSKDKIRITAIDTDGNQSVVEK
jgi:hypothetical protein